MAVTATAQSRIDEDELLYKKRHSLAHVMAEAVLKLIPEAQIAIGPPVDNGFYYDFELPRSLKEEDLIRIEHIMRQILKSNAAFVKEVVSKDQAAAVFGPQKYKQELLEGRGLERTVISSSDFRWNTDRAENAYSRAIMLTGYVRATWPKDVNERIQSVDTQMVMGTAISDDDAGLELWVAENPVL